MGTEVPTHSATASSADRVYGANERIGVGIVGCGLRGLGLGRLLCATPGVEVRAVSDVYEPRVERAAGKLGRAAAPVESYRAMLAMPDVDAVVIATPDHWHAAMASDSVAAGKDVYLEKPVSHSESEGWELLRQVERSGQVVATGTQQRTWDHFVEARRLVREGVLGKVTLARCHWHQGHLPAADELRADVDMARIDWKGWLGPARDQPFGPEKCEHWRFFWDFGGGSVGDLMTHWIDVIQWFLNAPRPSRVQALGMTCIHDWFETPDTVSAAMRYAEGFAATFDGSLTFGLKGCGIVFHGDAGMMTLDRSGFAVYEEGRVPFESNSLPDPTHRRSAPRPASSAERMDGSGTMANLRDWLRCIRERREPRANLRAGVEAADVAHFANRALREGRVVQP